MSKYNSNWGSGLDLKPVAMHYVVGGSFENELGLYNLSGNVWEWCSDYGDYSSSASINPTGPTTGFNRVLRGGSWNDAPADSRVANRTKDTPSYSADYVGFRVVSIQ